MLQYGVHCEIFQKIKIRFSQVDYFFTNKHILIVDTVSTGLFTYMIYSRILRYFFKRQRQRQITNNHSRTRPVILGAKQFCPNCIRQLPEI